MENIVVEAKDTLPVVSDTVIIDYLKSMGLNVNDEQAKKFIHIAKSFGLNPFKREIYAIPFGKNWNIIVGYETYIKRAERSKKLAGWKAWTEGDLKDGTLKGCVEIRRKDWDEPFYHEVYFDEYNQDNAMWKKKPRTMIKKVAIAQGFRLAFPDELAGMPYTADEIDTDEIQTEAIEEKDYKKLLADEMHKLGATTSELKKMFAAFLKDNGIDVYSNDGAKEALEEIEKVKSLYKEFEKQFTEQEELTLQQEPLN